MNGAGVKRTLDLHWILITIHYLTHPSHALLSPYSRKSPRGTTVIAEDVGSSTLDFILNSAKNQSGSLLHNAYSLPVSVKWKELHLLHAFEMI